MKNPFYIFRIKREERWGAVSALLYVVLWNVLVVWTYADRFFPLHKHYRRLFINTFHISGFDPLSYAVISRWDTEYNIYRHPLLAFFMWLPNQVNQGLIALTGHNWATVIMAVILVFCGFYSFILLYRTFREVIGLQRFDAWLLCWLTFSFGYVMVGISVPDHFPLSMFMLILTLYVAGRKLKAHHPFTIWQTVLFFIVTAGISLNNGIKVFLANLFVNGKKFWRPANLLLAILLPSLLIWVGARQEWKHFEEPTFVAKHRAKAARDSIAKVKLLTSIRDTMAVKDSDHVMQVYNQVQQQQLAKQKDIAAKSHVGKPINKTEFGQWTDISTPRLPSLVENVFGEPIQLHQDYTLQDVLRLRPIIVNYRWAINYIVEAVIVLLFIGGIVCGRRSRWLWLALSFFGFDLLIHVVFGFGLNEAYIMSPHWLFIINIAIGFLVRRADGYRMARPLRLLLLLFTAYLLGWNGVLYGSYLLSV